MPLVRVPVPDTETHLQNNKQKQVNSIVQGGLTLEGKAAGNGGSRLETMIGGASTGVEVPAGSGSVLTSTTLPAMQKLDILSKVGLSSLEEDACVFVSRMCKCRVSYADVH